ncbi:FG-GAP repeat domain-containing protein [Petrimonas sp.]|uniref:FG-GAP repeat domain-containing protein n=1 Tax=Petrimonas sp. TaxID=2023866 RepID=UPI002FCA4A64
MNIKYAFLILFFTVSTQYVLGQQWIDDTFEDFSKGEFEDSGQNIYITKQGQIKTIRRFDLNNDGYVDLIFNSTHNDDQGVPATIATASGRNKINTQFLDVRGSLYSTVRDVNNDGIPDIVFCPNTSGIQNGRRFVQIAYGGNDGWNESRLNGILPVNRIRDLVVADINNDGWPDIITLNSAAWLPNQPEGNIVRVFWGSDNGFILTNYKDIGVPNATKIVTGDFNNDNIEDIALLTNKSLSILPGADKLNEVEVFNFSDIQLSDSQPNIIFSADLDNDGIDDILIGGNKIEVVKGQNDLSFSSETLLTDVTTTSLSAGDVDKDGNVDIIISEFNMRKASGGESLGGSDDDEQNIIIFWGNNGKFSKSDVTALNAPYTVNAAIVDFDGDGNNDIICATHQSADEFTTESIIYWGNGDREFEKGDIGIPSHGAYHISVIPSSPTVDSTYLIVSNSKSGTLREEVPLVVYYGGPEGFDKNNVFEIPFRSGYESSAADLNNDGFVDLITVNSMHGGGADDPYRGVNIFWGSEKGLDLKNRSVFNEINVSTTNVVDLNKDGYLDIVVGFFDRYDKKPTSLVIYYGTENGYSSKNRVEISSEGRSTSPNIADYNNDGWLDIAVSSYTKDKIRIFYGGPNGFDENNQEFIMLPSIIDLETADLNNDGHLDIIGSSYKDKVDNFHDTGVQIFWGSPDGFNEWNAQWLEANTALGPLVADIDNDGYLDIFLPAYHGDNTRENLPCYIYWGSETGYSLDNRSKLTSNSASDAFAYDFNNDGLLDIVVVEHARNWQQSITTSRIFYNDGERFTSNKVDVDELPAPGPHWMWNYDIGNISNRKYEHAYISSEKEWKSPSTKGKIEVDAKIPENAKLSVKVRSAYTKSAIENAEWQKTDSGNFKLDKRDRFMQYKLILKSDNGDTYPIIDKVSININK